MDILESDIQDISGFDREARESALPIWFESLVGIDWTLLHFSPVYYGFSVPKGDGSATVVVPGFLGSDIYLYEMYMWLARIGYKPYLSGIGWNADCLNTLSEKLIETITKAHRETGRKVNLIGHSLGGVLSRSAAVRCPEMVGSVITLGSPFRGIKSHPKVLEMSKRIRSRIFQNSDKTDFPNCYTGYCHCAAVTSLQGALSKTIRQTAIYTKTDGIVDWHNCVSRNAENNFEVSGTHIGLVYNYQAYKIIAEQLAKNS